MKIASYLAAVSACALGCSAGYTQTGQADGAETQGVATGGGLGVIVVTAERRENSLQGTPLAITAFDDDFLESSNINDIQDISQYAPGLTFNRVSNFVQLNVRGIGLEQINLGGEPGVALHIDGVYVARPFVGEAIFSDLARVEVLRGPQGTLYGRNATGGSVNLISNEPTDELEGQLAFTVGNYSRLLGHAVVSGPLNENIRARVSASAERRGGYLLDLLDDERLDNARTWSARGQLAFDLFPDVELLLSGDYYRDGGTGPVFQPGSIAGTAAALGGRLDPDPRRLYEDGPHDQNTRAWGVSARLQVESGPIHVTSLTAYRNNRFRLISDLDGTDFFLINEDLAETGKQFSQEVQLSSAYDSPLQWVLGAYYFHEDGTLDYDFPVPILGTTIRFDATQQTRAIAAFGQATLAATDRLSLTAGLRWSYEKKTGTTVQDLFGVRSVDVEGSWSAFTPRFVVDYQATDDVLLYASVARGFKSGGLNTASLQADAYDPEYVWNYEIGLKSRFFDDRLQVNAAAFYYDYSDLQVNQFAVGQTFIENAAAASGQGLEIEVTALPVENLSITASAAFLDATFDQFMTPDSFRPTLGVLDLSGNDLPRAPGFTGNFAAQYDAPLGNGGTLSLRGEYSHRDTFYFTPFNTDFAEGGGFDLLNARIAYNSPGDRWQVAIFGKNLTNDTYEQTITVSGINAGTLVLFGPPRTYGAEFRFRF